MTDDHPLIGLVDHVREAGMVLIQSELAALPPVTWTAIDRDGDTWCVHVTWTREGSTPWARLSWDPENAFEVTAAHEQPRRFALPGDAVAYVAELVRGPERHS